MRLLAAVAALALLASASAVLPGPTTTSWSGAVSSLGIAGSPSARTLFISYASNRQEGGKIKTKNCTGQGTRASSSQGRGGGAHPGQDACTAAAGCRRGAGRGGQRGGGCGADDDDDNMVCRNHHSGTWLCRQPERTHAVLLVLLQLAVQHHLVSVSPRRKQQLQHASCVPGWPPLHWRAGAHARRRAVAEIFNPTCNTVVLDSYSILFVPSLAAPVLGDGDWSAATVLPFPSGASIPVRHAAHARTLAARRAGASVATRRDRAGVNTRVLGSHALN